MDAGGFRMVERKVLLMQRELRMETQMQETCPQIQTMGTRLKKKQPQTEDTIIKDLLKDTELSLPKPTAEKVTLKLKARSTTLVGLSGSEMLPSKHQQCFSAKLRISAVGDKIKSTCHGLMQGTYYHCPKTLETSSIGFTDF